jgi:hypothetical protein
MKDYLKRLAVAIVDRLQQESTWRGIIAVLTASGVYIKPDLIAPIVSLGMFLIGLINIGKNK